MQKSSTIYNELKELNSVLADFPNSNVFSVPEGYFDMVSAEFTVRLQHLSHTTTVEMANLAVPGGYFEGLADEIMSKIKNSAPANSTEASSVLLPAGLRSKNVFKVPAGYFENLAEDILVKLTKPSTKVVSMQPRMSFFKYAVAACITCILSVGIFNGLNNKQGSFTNATETGLAASSDDALQNGIEKALESLDDEEIINYLKNDGDDVNAALVASLTEEKNLPEEVEYMLNENTLDNLLQSYNIELSKNN